MHPPPTPAPLRSRLHPTRALSSGAATLAALALAGFSGGCGAPATAPSSAERSTPKEYQVDHLTTANVENALAADPALLSFSFNVETVDGAVELNGYVDRADQSAAAARDAAGVAGVTRVQNRIVVRQPAQNRPPPPVSITGDTGSPPPPSPPAGPAPTHSPASDPSPANPPPTHSP